MIFGLAGRIAVSAMLAGTLSGCDLLTISEDPCGAAAAPISFDTLYKNSVRGTYEQCLDGLRNNAVSALER